MASPSPSEGVGIVTILSLLGGFAGAITLVWRIFDTFRSYLHIEISTELIDVSLVRFRTVVENKNLTAKKLASAFLVIGPENETPAETVKKLLNNNFSDYTEMVRLVTEEIRVNHDPRVDPQAGRALIPLPYYFTENVDIADEKLSFEKTLDCSLFPKGNYSVRFYIEGAPRLHRLVHAVFHVR
jgi:hypothetical protein